MNNKKNLGIVAAVVSTVVYLICTFSEHGSIPWLNLITVIFVVKKNLMDAGLDLTDHNNLVMFVIDA